jgi:hypothetical protein
MPKEEHSVELAKMLEDLKTKEPTIKRFKGLTQEEREIYMNALNKKAKENRKKLRKLIKGIDL